MFTTPTSCLHSGDRVEFNSEVYVVERLEPYGLKYLRVFLLSESSRQRLMVVMRRGSLFVLHLQGSKEQTFPEGESEGALFE